MSASESQLPYRCHNFTVGSTTKSTSPKLSSVTMQKPVDPKANEALANNNQLKRYLAKRTSCTEEAADLYQESVVRVLEQAKKSAITNPVAYAIRIARNLLIKQDVKSEEYQDDAHCNAENPENKLEEAQRIELIYQALDNMPEQRRRVFKLRRINGETREEIAQQLGITVECVTRHTSRAMVDIQRYLEAQTK